MTDIHTTIAKRREAEAKAAAAKTDKATDTYWRLVCGQLGSGKLSKKDIDELDGAMRVLEFSADDLQEDLENLTQLGRIRSDHDLDEAQAKAHDAGATAAANRERMASLEAEIARLKLENSRANSSAAHALELAREQQVVANAIADGLRTRGCGEIHTDLMKLRQPNPSAPPMPHQATRLCTIYGRELEPGDILDYAGPPTRCLEPIELPHRALKACTIAGAKREVGDVFHYGGPPLAYLERLPKSEWPTENTEADSTTAQEPIMATVSDYDQHDDAPVEHTLEDADEGLDYTEEAIQ